MVKIPDLRYLRMHPRTKFGGVLVSDVWVEAFRQYMAENGVTEEQFMADARALLRRHYGGRGVSMKMIGTGGVQTLLALHLKHFEEHIFPT